MRKLTKTDEAELIEAYQLGYSMGAIARCMLIRFMHSERELVEVAL
jgi:hypothetical protein